MNRIILALALGVSGFWCGCRAVREARCVQHDMMNRVSSDIPVADQVDLRGRTLADLVAYAHRHRPSMHTGALAVEDARLLLREIAADAPLVSAMPWNALSSSVSAGYSASASPAHLSDLDGTHKGTAQAGLSLDLLVWDFGREKARAQAQAQEVLAAEFALREEGLKVFEEVCSAYFAWKRNLALRTVAESAVATREAHLRQAEDRLALGEAIVLDVTRARLELAAVRETAVAASNDVITASIDLLTALGIGAVSRVDEDLLKADGEALQEMTPVLEMRDDRMEAFSAEACRLSPSVEMARARVRAACARVDWAIADMRPELRASLGLNWADPLWTWHWGASAVQSLFTGFRKTTAVDRAVVSLKTAVEAFEREMQTLAQAVHQTAAERASAREALAAAEVRWREARENLDRMQLRETVGEASRIDLADAMTALDEAAGNRIRAFYREQAAEARLYRLIGLNPEYCGEGKGDLEK